MSDERPALVGLAGPQLLPVERDCLQRLRPAGLLLFARNAIDRDQLAALVHEVRTVLAAVGVAHAVVAVDEEGGAVAPLDRVLDSGPSAASLGWIDDLSLTRTVHRARARALAALGVDLVLAPVADVDRPGNPVIATRSFGSDALTVGAHVEAAIHGLQAGGVRACVKHWPGHGSPRLDSHIELPSLTIDETTRLRIDAPPFAAAVRAGVDAMMLAHLHVPAWSPRAQIPLGVVPDAIVRLRQETGFAGPLLSDAVEMKGLAGRGPRQLLEAGIDLVLFARPIAALGAECEELPLRTPLWTGAAHSTPRSVDEQPMPATWFGVRRSGGVEAWRRAPRVWIVDAASNDRLLRLPIEGEDPLEGGRPLDPKRWGDLHPRAEVHVLPAADLEGAQGAAPWNAEDAVVVLAVRPLAEVVEQWLTSAPAPAALLRFGAAALHREPVGGVGFTLLCPEIRPRIVAGILSEL